MKNGPVIAIFALGAAALPTEPAETPTNSVPAAVIEPPDTRQQDWNWHVQNLLLDADGTSREIEGCLYHGLQPDDKTTVAAVFAATVSSPLNLI